MNRFFWMVKHNTLMVVYIVATLTVLAIITVLFWIYKTLCKNRVCDNNKELEEMSQSLIRFSIEELKQATNNFGESNLIGSGSFGPVYNGLVRDTIVAIKKLSGSLRPRFLAEVTYLSTIRHRNVVNVLGYCCENRQQMIIYEYLVNGSLRDHLHDLNFKKRISIALGAGKGLLHLHSLTPPLTHNRFKMAKVLLDADFNPKVSNAGLSRLLETSEEEADIHDPEVGLDMYSFGLFLLELLTGEEPIASKSNDEFTQWIGPRILSNTFVDTRINGTFTIQVLKSVMKITLECLKFPAIKRPKMEEVVTELEMVYQKYLTGEEDDSTQFTLGSELFSMIS